MAATTCGWQWPVLQTAIPEVKSRNRLESTSSTQSPLGLFNDQRIDAGIGLRDELPVFRQHFLGLWSWKLRQDLWKHRRPPAEKPFSRNSLIYIQFLYSSQLEAEGLPTPTFQFAGSPRCRRPGRASWRGFIGRLFFQEQSSLVTRSRKAWRGG